jgi:hypothetical protein
MRAAKNQLTAVQGESFDQGAAAPDLASIGLLDDDGSEETAVRARPAEIAREPSPEFIEIDLTPLDRAPEPVRPR